MVLEKLEALASQESAVYENLWMGGATTPESEAAAYAAYHDIFQGYVGLAREHHSTEALKRAVFLMWYSAAEPSHLTGVPEFELQIVQEAAALLIDHARAGELDEEFRGMLTWYYTIASWYFNVVLQPQQLEVLEKCTPSAGVGGVNPRSFVDLRTPRGALSQYFASVGWV